MRRHAGALLVPFVAAGLLLAEASSTVAQSRFEVPNAASHELGDPDAPIVIVEFADFGCELCGAFARETMPRVKRDWINTGRARVQFVPFDLLRTGRLAARAAECAAEQDAFWPMHDLIYQKQNDWLGRGGQDEKFAEWAVELGLDEQRFAACWDEDPSEERIEQNTKLSRSLGIRGTPTFLINGKVVIGAYPYDKFAAILEEVAQGR